MVIGAASLFVQGDAFEVIRKLIETVGKGIGMLGAVAMAFVGRDRNIVRHAYLAILFMLLCSPMIQPWYLLWAIPMLAATGLRSHFQLMWYFITTLFFMAYGVSDQLNVSPYLRDFNQDMVTHRDRHLLGIHHLPGRPRPGNPPPGVREPAPHADSPHHHPPVVAAVPRRIKPPCTPPRGEESRTGSRQGRLLARQLDALPSGSATA